MRTRRLRPFAAAPLLLLGIAVSWSFVLQLQGEPSPEARPGWIAGCLITAALALYFFAGYFAVVARNYLVMAILTLWAWHLLVLAPFLSPCETNRHFDKFRQMMGFGVPEFAIVVAFVAIGSSVAMYWRYRKFDGSPAVERRRFLRISVAAATIASAALVATAYWMVPLLRGVYSDLPTQTFLLFATYRYWIILPLACGIAFLYVSRKGEYSEGRLQIALNSVVGLILMLNLVASAFVSAALSPLRTMGCVV